MYKIIKKTYFNLCIFSNRCCTFLLLLSVLSVMLLVAVWIQFLIPNAADNANSILFLLIFIFATFVYFIFYVLSSINFFILLKSKNYYHQMFLLLLLLIVFPMSFCLSFGMCVSFFFKVQLLLLTSFFLDIIVFQCGLCCL